MTLIMMKRLSSQATEAEETKGFKAPLYTKGLTGEASGHYTS